MQTTTVKHPTEIVFYNISILMQNIAYYGLRSILVVFLIDSAMETSDAYSFFGTFTTAIYLAYAFGGIVGDFLFGNKFAAISGGVLMSAGSLILYQYGYSQLEIGTSCIAIGSGLYRPNLLASVGKSYRINNTDSSAGLSLIYLMVNIGALAGVYIMSLIQEPNFKMCFLYAGILFLFASAFLFLAPDHQIPNSKTKVPSTATKGLLVMAAIGIVAIYWMIYEYGYSGFSYVFDFIKNHQPQWKGSSINQLFSDTSSYAGLIIGLILVFLWSFFSMNKFLKLGIGLAITMLAFFLLLAIPQVSESLLIPLVVTSGIMLSIGEYLIAPTVLSVIMEYGRHDMLGTMVAVQSLTLKLGNLLIVSVTGLVSYSILDSTFTLWTGTAVLGTIALCVILLTLLVSPTKTNSEEIEF